MQHPPGPFDPPTPIERGLNKLFGALLRLGLGLSHNYLLHTRGRRSGRWYTTPVNVLSRDGKRYLVAGRGYTQWVRNALASGTVRLSKGWHSDEFRVREIPDEEKPPILKAYLDRFTLTVQRYFPVTAGSPPEAFTPLVSHYPVFELAPKPPE